jgi:hypothetical protein
LQQLSILTSISSHLLHRPLKMNPVLPLREELKDRQGSMQAIEHPNGLSELAFLISTDQDFSIFRKFDELSALNLLRLQSTLTGIESELRLLDQREMAGDLNEAEASRKDDLMEQLDGLLKKYRMEMAKRILIVRVTDAFCRQRLVTTTSNP